MPVCFLFTSGAIVLLRMLLPENTSINHAAVELSLTPSIDEGRSKFFLTY